MGFRRRDAALAHSPYTGWTHAVWLMMNIRVPDDDDWYVGGIAGIAKDLRISQNTARRAIAALEADGAVTRIEKGPGQRVGFIVRDPRPPMADLFEPSTDPNLF